MLMWGYTARRDVLGRKGVDGPLCTSGMTLTKVQGQNQQHTHRRPASSPCLVPLLPKSLVSLDSSLINKSMHPGTTMKLFGGLSRSPVVCLGPLFRIKCIPCQDKDLLPQLDSLGLVKEIELLRWGPPPQHLLLLGSVCSLSRGLEGNCTFSM